MTELEQDWKTELKLRCINAIALLPDDIGAEGETEEESDTPALYAFYEELLAMRNEVRRVNRKTADTFTRFGDVLEGMQTDSTRLRELLARGSNAKEKKSGVSRNMALSMVELLDRIRRLESAARTHDQKGWRAAFQAKKYSEKQNGALSFLAEHLKKLLAEAKVEPINARAGDRFDPLYMKAIGSLEMLPDVATAGVESELIVTEECLAGFRIGEHCLRPAEVRLTRQKSS